MTRVNKTEENGWIEVQEMFSICFEGTQSQVTPHADDCRKGRDYEGCHVAVR